MDTISQDANEQIDMMHVVDSAIDEVHKGTILYGELVTADSQYAYVNVGMKSDGRIPIEEFDEPPVIGRTIPVMLKNKKTIDGMFQFSTRDAVAELQWRQFIERYESGDRTIRGTIASATNKGKIVNCGGVTAFLPFSLAADLKGKNHTDEENDFIIKSVDRKKRSVLVSRKDYLDEEMDAQWKAFTERYKVGDVVRGTATKYVEFGVFVRVEGLTALLHRNDISWRKVFKQRRIVKIGEEREFVILSINDAERKISLGLKQLTEDPWIKAPERFHPGDRVNGRVVTLTHRGAFVEIEEGIDGFVHSSDLSWSKSVVNPRDILKKGSVYDFQVLEVIPSERTILLGYKQLLPNPWETVAERFPVGSVHTKTVKSIAKFGVFVELEEGIDGLVHLSDISWDEGLSSVPDTFRPGDSVEIKILEVNPKERRISCGIKQLTKSPWEIIKEKYPPRSIVEGVVSGIMPFGIFVKIEDNCEGLVHISEVSRRRVENLEEYFKVGDRVSAMVLGVDVARKRLSLSIKSYDAATEKEALDNVMKNTKPSKVTLGDIVHINLENK